MNPTAIASLSALLLAGCNAVSENVVRANNTVQRAVYDAAEHVQHWTDPLPQPDSAQVPHTAFCYRGMGDIICYDSPRPDIPNPMTGYQASTPVSVPLSAAVAPRNAMMVGNREQARLITPGAVDASSKVNPPNFVEKQEVPEAPAVAASTDAPSENVTGAPVSLMPRY